jgi:hypothetical protein
VRVREAEELKLRQVEEGRQREAEETRQREGQVRRRGGRHRPNVDYRELENEDGSERDSIDGDFLEMRTSTIGEHAGNGVYALKDIPKGRLLTHYRGTDHATMTVSKNNKRVMNMGTSKNTIFRVGVEGSIATSFNHVPKKDANVACEKGGEVYTLKVIKAGTEMFLDYGPEADLINAPPKKKRKKSAPTVAHPPKKIR